MKKCFFILFFSLLMVGCRSNNSSSVSLSNSFSDDISIDENMLTKIYTIDDFKSIKNNLEGNYILENDIYLDENWESIGIEQLPFKGYFDGNNHTIFSENTTFKINQEYENSKINNGVVDFEYNGFGGIFGYNTGYIKNLNINGNYYFNVNELPDVTNSNIDFNAYTLKYKVYLGILVGYNDGTISNVKINGKLDIKDNIERLETSYLRVGLLNGKNTGTIKYTRTIGEIDVALHQGKNGRIGGMIGSTGNCLIKESFAEVKINVLTSYSNAFVGGFVGYMEGGSIENSYALSSSIDVTGSINDNGNVRLGGFVGCIDTLEKVVDIKNSYAKITNLNAVGKKNSIGGFVGLIDLLKSASINSSFSEVKVLTSSAKSDADNQAGLFIGQVNDSMNKNSLNVINSYYISGTIYEININNNYATQKDISELIYVLNWDFENIWTNEFKLKIGENDG